MTGTKSLLVAALLASTLSSGCIYVTVTPSVNGKAFIAQKKLIGGSSFWNCDATNGTPTCWQVKHVPNGSVSTGGGSSSSSAPAAPAAEASASGEAASE